MEIGELLHFNTRAEWRAWLEANHQEKREVWLLLAKAGRSDFRLAHAVEEALCFGWIDSQLKPRDAASYALRFSPRRKQSYWAASNRARALRLLQEGKMTPAGLAVLPDEILAAWETQQGG